MASGEKKLSDIDIAVALEALSGGVGSVQEAVLRIEALFGDLPCEDYLERIVRLEKDRDSHEKQLATFLDHIEKMYKITRLQAVDIATLTQENKGQDAWSAKVWVLILLGIQTVVGIVAYFITH